MFLLKAVFEVLHRKTYSKVTVKKKRKIHVQGYCSNDVFLQCCEIFMQKEISNCFICRQSSCSKRKEGEFSC